MNDNRQQLLRASCFLSLALCASMSAPLFAGEAPSHGPSPHAVAIESAPPEALPVASALPAVGGMWQSQGPTRIANGQSDGTANGEVIGAVQAIVPHPTNANIVWIGTVNGGVWMTTNATNASPTWVAGSDTFASLSIGAMQRDPTDGTHSTVVAAHGRFSSFAGVGGPRSGILRTTNSGANWTAAASTGLIGRNVSGIAPRGATIVVSVDIADNFTCSDIGIYRSTNTGASFTAVSGAAGSGLPLGRAFDLAGDPTNNAVLYTAIRDTPVCSAGAGNGIYKSTDTGATWTKVSSAAMEALMTDALVGNTRIAVGASGQVYAGIINNGRLAGLFRSATGSGSWTQLDTPSTNEGGIAVGIQPGGKPGGQGNTHFSIVADPANANIVYVGGDRQPVGIDGGIEVFPNSIGASNFTGRLFRVDASLAPGTQARSLTHCATATAACNSTISTSNNSAPHADSRRLAFDASGNLLEADDGGIYRRSNPGGTGDWFSMNGNLRITEMHDVAYDRVSNMITGGNQDNGTAEQTTAGGTIWNTVNQGDGGDVAIDDVSSATESIRYTSSQNLGGFRRRTMNASGVSTLSLFPARTVTGGGPGFVGQFATPVELNAMDPAGILFAGLNDLYESFDRGDTITALGFNQPATAIVFGGRSSGIDNPDLIYALFEEEVYVRTAGAGAPVLTATQPAGARPLRDIAVDPSDWRRAYVINDLGQVFWTSNTGGIWTNITGDLAGGTTDLRSIVFIPGSPGAVVVGGLNGVFRTPTDGLGVWKQFGTGLTNAVVWDLDYDAGDDTLVASTMGRGAFKLTPAATLGPLPSLSINDVAVTEGNAGTTNANFTVTLSAASAGTVTVNYATANGTATQGSITSSNAAAVTIASSGSASPYPSDISIAGATGTITKVTATLTGFSHTYPSDADILLVGPAGQSVILMADAGSSADATSLNFTFDDAAAAFLGSGTLGSGTFKPTNIDDGDGLDAWTGPAPVAPYGSALSVFNGTAPNGVWSLYVVDDVNGDSGTIAGGWTLNLVTTGGDFTAASGMLTFAPGVLTQPVTVVVNGDAANEPNETFFVNLTLPSNATVADAQGQGTINNDDGAAVLPPTNVVATATGATTVNVTWTAAAGAASYRVYRKSGAGAFALVGSPASSPFNDATAAAGTGHLYKVRSFSGSESADSNVDLATTVLFTDPAITAQATGIKASHFNELLTSVNAVRALALLAPVSFTAPAPATSITVRRQHMLDLRAGLDAARSTLLLPALTYTDPSITAGATAVKAAHLNEVRNGVK